MLIISHVVVVTLHDFFMVRLIFHSQAFSYSSLSSRDVTQSRFPDTVKKLVDLIGGCNFDFG